TTACAANLSWLKLDQSRSLLCCADGGLTNSNDTLYSFRKAKNGTLMPSDSLSIINGAVSLDNAFFFVLAELVKVLTTYHVEYKCNETLKFRSILGWVPRAR
ncbi:hypothetical protein LZ30DRAFT_597365, partial [Colletotrichum cereale]